MRLLGIAGIILFFPGWAIGHPLGNFSLNHYAVIELQPGELISQHVLDFAEIPSFNELANLDTNGDNLVSPDEMRVYKNSSIAKYLKRYSFALAEGDRETLPLEQDLIGQDVILSQGQGALTCLQLRFTCAFRHPALQKEGKKRFLFIDNNDTYIGGIREIRIRVHPGVELKQEDIHSKEPAAPVQSSNNTFFFNGLDATILFNLVEERQPPNERTIADIVSLMDPRSIPIYPLTPDENGNYKILKSPIRPDMEVQKQIADLQPRAIISASGILGEVSPVPDQNGTISSFSTPESNPNSKFNRSGARDAEWAAMIGSDQLSSGVILLAIFVSLIAGASHALSPGHGKTVVAAYLVGSRGTIWHAVFLGIVVTLTHVSSVLLLGVITLVFYQYVVPDRLNPILESFSGLLIVIIGITIFFRRYGAYQRKKVLKNLGITSSHFHHHHPMHDEEEEDHDHEHLHIHDHDHSHDHWHDSHGHVHENRDDREHVHTHTDEQVDEYEDEHDHDHNHEYAHEHGPHTHTHEIPADANWRDLLVLGITGGIVPCPAALLVLLSAVALHRLLFGLLLIVFFSIGLAAVLITIGILMVSAKQLLDRYVKNEESFAWLQIASPVLVTLLGLVIFLRGLQIGGFISFNF